MADETRHPNPETIPNMSAVPRQRCGPTARDENAPVQNMLSLIE